ncbi:hypothetical protein ABBQ32_012216 [Trebouxia sp. C0010 RCD-2024]
MQKLRHAPQPLNVFIAQEVYRVLLFSIFLAQVVVVRYVPYIGPGVRFLLTSWVYAFYWFDYKWSLTNLALEKRIQFFQSHWAYFAGFGSLCIIPQLLFPFLLSEALMGMAFPLFVLMACESDPRAQYEQGMSRHIYPLDALGCTSLAVPYTLYVQQSVTQHRDSPHFHSGLLLQLPVRKLSMDGKWSWGQFRSFILLSL